MGIVGIFSNLFAHPVRPSYFFGRILPGFALIVVRDHIPGIYSGGHLFHVARAKANMDGVA
jgi:hypothetical protein